MTLNERLLKLWYGEERRRRQRRRENEDFNGIAGRDNEIYVRLSFSSTHYDLLVQCHGCSWDFKGTWRSKRFHPEPPRLGQLKNKGKNRRAFRFDCFLVPFHVSLNKLWTYFPIHWIGDNLLLLLTSLGSKRGKSLEKQTFLLEESLPPQLRVGSSWSELN